MYAKHWDSQKLFLYDLYTRSVSPVIRDGHKYIKMYLDKVVFFFFQIRVLNACI